MLDSGSVRHTLNMGRGAKDAMRPGARARSATQRQQLHFLGPAKCVSVLYPANSPTPPHVTALAALVHVCPLAYRTYPFYSCRWHILGR